MRKAFFMSTMALLSMCLYTGQITAQESVSPVTPLALRCEYQKTPLGVDVHVPRLSWQLDAPESAPRGLTQTAYQILVADSLEALTRDEGSLWDSDKVVSNVQLHIPYAGETLQSGQRVWWKVRVWDNTDKASAYSAPSWWEMGLLTEENWTAQWIGRSERNISEEKDWYADRPAPLLRKTFSLDRPVKSARAYVTGLGYYELRLNGAKVGDHELDTAWTAYDHRIFYSVYDITEQLIEGDNVVGGMLGNGWYNPLPMKMWGRFNLREALAVGNPCLRAQVEITYEDGQVEHIVTDESWRTAEGPIRKNSVYLGEVYDAREDQPGWDATGFDDSAWDTAACFEVPAGKLEAQPLPPIRVTDTLKPVSVEEVSPGVYLFDAGENLAGRVRINVSGPAGTRIAIRYGELRYPDGQLNPMTAVWGQNKNREIPEGSEKPSTAWQEDVYILHGEGRYRSPQCPFPPNSHDRQCHYR